MKKALAFNFTLVFIAVLFLKNSVAQEYTRWGLPEGAIARVGKGSISDIQYSPDGTRLAVAGSIGVWVYDTVTHQESALFTGHPSGVHSVAFSPNGGIIASGYGDGTIRLREADTGKLQRTLTGHTSGISSVAFSPDGATIASGSWDSTIRMWNAITGEHVRTLSGHTKSVWYVKSRCAERR